MGYVWGGGPHAMLGTADNVLLAHKMRRDIAHDSDASLSDLEYDAGCVAACHWAL